MNNAEEATKIAKDVHFAVLGRAIADAANSGAPLHQLLQEAQILRRREQDGATRQTNFAALTRQIGDAARNGKDTAPHIAAIVALRRAELGYKPNAG
jgi:hypothetical protein